MSPEEFGGLVATDMQRMKRVVRDTGIKPD
jgi:hypothetical protein